jgi:hypothetical protein
LQLKQEEAAEELRQQDSKKIAAPQLLTPLEMQQGSDGNNNKLTEKCENLPTFLFGIFMSLKN